MPPTETSKIIQVILPSGTPCDCYYDRSTTPGNWRHVTTDQIILPGDYAAAVLATTLGGEQFIVHWNADTQTAWKAIDGPDEQLTAEQQDSIILVDLTTGEV